MHHISYEDGEWFLCQGTPQDPQDCGNGVAQRSDLAELIDERIEEMNEEVEELADEERAEYEEGIVELRKLKQGITATLRII